MSKIVRFFLFAALLVVAATPARAQQGFALKGHYLFNESKVKGTDSIPAADGFSVGAELVLPLGIGVGVSAYATGNAEERDRESTSFGVLAEANYFIGVPILPISPYIGVHAGLGRYTAEDVGTGTRPEIQDKEGAQLGYQAGVRVQLSRFLGLDAQYRRVSQSADEGDDLDRNQVLVGVTLF